MKLFRTFLIIATIVATAYSQPRVHWQQIYATGDNLSDILLDVYACNNGDYAMCGKSYPAGNPGGMVSWVMRVDAEGEIIWSRRYDALREATSLIETEDGGLLIGGGTNFTVVKTDADGNQEWTRGYGGRNIFAVIEQKDGNFVLAGEVVIDEFQWYDGKIVKIDEDGEVLWSRTDGGAGLDAFRALRETENAEIVAGGYLRHSRGNRVMWFWLLKVNADGEFIWEQVYDQRDQSDWCYDLISCQGGGFLMTGKQWDVRNPYDRDFLIMRVDDEGELIWTRQYDDEDNVGISSCYSAVQFEDGGFGLVGPGIRNAALMMRIDEDGDEQWHQYYRDGPVFFQTVLLNPDGSTITCGNFIDDGNPSDGLLMKLVPERSPPQILSYVPDSLEFNILLGDTTWFAVAAVDLQEDELFFTWTIGDDTVSTDTSTTITFDELGDINVKCLVSDGDQADSVMWLAHVGEFYIDTYTPDSLSWTIRRPREVDFELGVRAIEGVEPQFRWILTGHRGAWENVGNEANLTYEFDRPGEYSLEGRAFHDGTVHSVTWQIAVRSVLYWWTPHERELTIDLHDEIEFNLLPFNPNSDSLDFRWLIDGELDENELDAGLFYSFGDLGDHSVTAIVHDGAEVDTVIWSITVEDPNAVKDGTEGLLPTEVTLYPAAPNPFNSTTWVRYFLPHSADVRLTVYDSAGRLVQILSEELTVAGEHRATLHGSELPAGVYLLRLEVGDVVQSMKVVLLK